MQIKETKNKDIFEVFFTDEESRLASSIIGNTFSGASLWRILPENFEKEVGIAYNRASELSDMILAYTSIPLSKEELQAIKKMTGRLFGLWDEGDFSTMIGTEKSEVGILIKEFEKNGI